MNSWGVVGKCEAKWLKQIWLLPDMYGYTDSLGVISCWFPSTDLSRRWPGFNCQSSGCLCPQQTYLGEWPICRAQPSNTSLAYQTCLFLREITVEKVRKRREWEWKRAKEMEERGMEGQEGRERETQREGMIEDWDNASEKREREKKRTQMCCLAKGACQAAAELKRFLGSWVLLLPNKENINK